MAKANERRQDAEKLRASLTDKEEVLNERKSRVEVELAGIQPMVDAAKAAVGQIRRDSLNELRMLRLPPEAINDVLSGVLILMGNFDTSWRSMKKFLAKPSVKQEIMNYDARRVTPQIRQKAQQLLREKADSFDPKRIQRVSVAAAPLAAWFKANISYSLVLEKIGPLENELNEAQRDIEHAHSEMDRVENELVQLDGEVAMLKANFTKIASEAEVLKISLKEAHETLHGAQTLLHKLSEEKHRWDEQVGDIDAVTSKLPKYCLLVAHFIAYLGGCQETVRAQCLRQWMEITGVEGPWDLLRFMNQESDLLEWKAQGLPDDQSSYENAMIMLNIGRTVSPFIIDPNGDATKWLVSYLEQSRHSKETSHHQVVQQNDPRFMKQMELSVRFGKSIIVTDMDEIHPCLYPLLRKDIYKQGARDVIRIGTKHLDYNPNFRMLLMTRNSNFTIPSRCKALVIEIDFSVTKSGLESQLLAMALRAEQPELESKKSQLLQQEEQYKMQLAELERELLEQLAMSTGNILENTSLIESLNNTKIQSQNIKQALQQSAVVQHDLDQQREIYRVLAVIGSNTYFAMKSLQSLNNMYRFSLSSFLYLFQSNLQRMSSFPERVSSERENVQSQQQHLKHLEQNVVSMVYEYVSRSIFKADRLTFGLHLVHSLYPDICGENEWEFFTGEMMTESGATASIQTPSWMNRQGGAQKSFKELAVHFPGLVSKCKFSELAKSWSQWLLSDHPESTLATNPLSKVTGSFSDFQHLLLIQALRKDRLSVATGRFIQKYVLSASSFSESSEMRALYENETSHDIPILFVTTPGADPATELRELAAKTVGEDRYREMAMSSGQQHDAIQMIQVAAERGSWVCLKNLHLVLPWIKDLQQLLVSLTPSRDFRLWLTTESVEHFPSVLLQNCLKMTCETPPGLRANLTRTLSAWSDSLKTSKNTLRAQLLFVLSWFHGIVQERRNYIPSGWSKYYQFNQSDLRASMDILESIFVDQTNSVIPWEMLRGLLSKAIYGGRIDNIIDENTLNSYLQCFFNPDVISSDRRAQSMESTPGSKWLANIPRSVGELQYSNLIRTVPNVDSPDIFGLPPNANHILSLQKAKQLVHSLKRLSVVNVLADVSSMDVASQIRETRRKRVGPLIKFWKSGLKTKRDSLVDDKGKKQHDPVMNAIALEMERVDTFIRQIDEFMVEIEKGLFGNGSLSESTNLDVTEMISGVVPWSWNRHWNGGHGPTNPNVFLGELLSRREVLQNWSKALVDGTFWTMRLSIGRSFYPKTLLNAFKQYTAHQQHTTMDALELKCVWDRSAAASLSMPVLTVDGLFFEGVRFDGRKVSDVHAEDPPLSKAPVCYLYYDALRPERQRDGSCVDCPVYYSLDRSYKVLTVRLAVDCPQKWRLSGFALIMTDVY